MALRCRPGDIAVVVEGTSAGVFVDVLQRSPDHPMTGLPAWTCRVKGPCPVSLVNMRTRRVVSNTVIPPGSIAMFVDAILQPIRPPKPPEATPAPPIELEYN